MPLFSMCINTVLLFASAIEFISVDNVFVVYALPNPLLYPPVELDINQTKNAHTVHERIRNNKQCLLCARASRPGTARASGTRS